MAEHVDDIAPVLRRCIWGGTDPYRERASAPAPQPVVGWYSDHPVLRELIAARRPARLAEVGSLQGASAIHIAGLLESLEIPGHLVCIDTFLGGDESYFEFRGQRDARTRAGQWSFFDGFLDNVAGSGLARYVTPFPQTSLTAAAVMRRLGLRFDFIYLDASHEYADVLADLRAWYPLLAPGGVLVGDDFEEPWFGVIRAAMEFADEVRQPLRLSKARASSPAGGRENTKFMLERPDAGEGEALAAVQALRGEVSVAYDMLVDAMLAVHRGQARRDDAVGAEPPGNFVRSDDGEGLNAH